MRFIGSKDYAPLLPITAFALALKAYDPIRSPVVGALDPWSWVFFARYLLSTGRPHPFFFGAGYPPSHAYMVAAIASLGIDAYEVVRYMPIVYSLNVIPVYLLALYVFESRRIAVLTSLLTATTRYHFMRTSIGVPEGIAQIAWTLTLLYLLKSLEVRRWTYRVPAAIFMAASILYYHFTMIILAPFLIALPFLRGFKGDKATLKVLGGVTIPAILLSGVAWYFRVLDSFIKVNFCSKAYEYRTPIVEASPKGSLYLLGYSILNIGAVTLSNLGYLLVISALLGFASLLLLRKVRGEMEARVRFLAAYLVVLSVLALTLKILYNFTHIAGAAPLPGYLFSWLAMPVAAFASYAIIMILEAPRRYLTQAFPIMRNKRSLRAISICILLCLCLVNLSAIDYYKVGGGGGIGLLKGHYYYKTMTDEEYYGLKYIRDNTPVGSIVLVVGVEGLMLNYQAIASQRTVVSIRDLKDGEGTILADMEIVYPDLSHENVTGVKVSFNFGEGRPIYFIDGIRNISLDVARRGGSPPFKKALMEERLRNEIMRSTGWEYAYSNDQITVLQVSSIVIHHKI
jgi:hypothetical protein